MSRIQLFGWIYALLFFGVVAIDFVPGLKNANGELFGLFYLEPKDHILHGASAIWAALAAWRSTRATLYYFRIFGVIYALDGLLGLATGQGYLDGGIILNELFQIDLMTRIATNLPHILIGGVAVWIGYIYSRRAEVARASAT